MKRLMIVVITSLMCMTGCTFYHQQSVIVPIYSFTEVNFNTINTDALVVFDVDDTLIQPTEVSVLLMNSTEGGRFIEKMIKAHPEVTDWDDIMTQISLQMHRTLIEPDIIPVIIDLQKRGVSVIVCTAMNVIVPCHQYESTYKWRYDHLKSFGFEGSYSEIVHQFEHDDKHPIFYKGMLATDLLPKGPSIGAFLDYMQLHPQSIIMFDDNYDFLLSIKEECVKRNIIFTGYHYLGAQQRVKQAMWNEQLATDQMELLLNQGIWLSDEQMKHYNGAQIKAVNA